MTEIAEVGLKACPPTDGARLYCGLVGVQVQRDAVAIDQHNECYADWAASENEARGHWVAHAMGKHPKGKVIYQAVYDITELARNDPDRSRP